MASYTVTGKNGTKEVPFEYLSELTDELDKLHTSKKELSETDIYKITLWKINRYPKIRNTTILKDLNSLRKLNRFEEEATKSILSAMLPQNGIGLAMASTYLRFSNPKIYPIIDTRALRAAFDYEDVNVYENILSTHCGGNKLYEKQIDLYIDYVNKLIEISKTDYHGLKIDFENLDRFLYDIDEGSGFLLSDKEPFDKEKLAKWEKIIMDYGGKIEKKNV